MEHRCPHCRETFLSFGHKHDEPLTCPICRKAVASAVSEVQGDPAHEAEGTQRVESPGQDAEETHRISPAGPDQTFGTLFQPGLFLRTVLGPRAEAPPGPTGTESLPESPSLTREPPQPALAGYLEVSGTDVRIPLESHRLVVGRAAEADLTLDDHAVSSEHFAIEVRGHEVFVRDLSSHNGTYLNGARVRHCELLPDDEIRAGSTVVTLRVSAKPRR